MKYTICCLLLMWSFWSKAQKPEVFSTRNGAIDGYDPVAFFKASKPVQGKKEYSITWNNAVWYFSSAANRDDFSSNPEKYAPQFGGWCAYGTAAGHKSPTQTETWSIVENKLYFNYNNDVKLKWTSDQKRFIEDAIKNWPVVKLQ